MIFNGALFGCAVLVVLAVKVLGRYLFEDPCSGDGNFRDPVEFYYEKDEDDDDAL